MELYDDTKAIAFIREHLDGDVAAKYDDDEFQNVIDIIMDWYEDNDLLDADIDDNDIDNDRDALLTALTRHVSEILSKDKGAKLLAEDVKAVVDAELAYEDYISQL